MPHARRTPSRRPRSLARWSAAALGAVAVAGAAPAAGAAGHGGSFLGRLTQVRTITSTVPGNGDVNPYGIAVVPATTGRLVQGDVLVSNFNDAANLQGTGTTVVEIGPDGAKSLFAQVPKDLGGCPGGVGLSTALAVLSSGWVVVGSVPSTDGTTGTAGAGCLIVLDRSGHVAGTISGDGIDGPWDMAAVDHGDGATLYVTNALVGVGAPGQPTQDMGTVVRLDLAETTTTAPWVTSATTIGSGFPESANASAFVLGPTGDALVGGTLYVDDSFDNEISAIPDAATTATSDGTGRTVTTGGALDAPLGMTAAPDGDLLVVNGGNGRAVEIAPSGRQVDARFLDRDRGTTPPGSGALFGLTVAPSGHALYFVRDDSNTLAAAS